MPYRSERQRGWAHTPAGTAALGGPEKVAEWDKATEHMRLPERANEPPQRTTRTGDQRRAQKMTRRKRGKG